MEDGLGFGGWARSMATGASCRDEGLCPSLMKLLIGGAHPSVEGRSARRTISGAAGKWAVGSFSGRAKSDPAAFFLFSLFLSLFLFWFSIFCFYLLLKCFKSIQTSFINFVKFKIVI
jgi:hypothetical protein